MVFANASLNLSVKDTSGSGPFDEDFMVNPGVVIAVLLISLIVTIVVFVALVERKKAPRSSFLRWLREYLNFRSILIAGIIKFVYLFLATLLTLMGIVVMFMGKGDAVLAAVLAGFAMIIFGNIGLRLILEMTMITIGLWENTSDIRAVLVKDEEAPEEKAPKMPKEKKEEKVEQIAVEEPTSVEIEK